MRRLLIFPLALTSALAFGQADWRPVSISALEIAQRAVKVFKMFKGVDGAVSIRIKDPKGKGVGRFNPMWRTAKIFHLQHGYIDIDRKSEVLATEHLIADGSGRIKRLAPTPGAKRVKPTDPAFNVSSDAALVEAWPWNFPRWLNTTFVGGNATLTRYVAALTKGVGGYKVRVDERMLPLGTRMVHDYRIFADRSAKGNLPASRVEMIFDADIGLPVNIHATRGALEQMWLCRWRNNLKFPDKPFHVGKW